jgi:hypothetical protein
MLSGGDQAEAHDLTDPVELERLVVLGKITARFGLFRRISDLTLPPALQLWQRIPEYLQLVIHIVILPF